MRYVAVRLLGSLLTIVAGTVAIFFLVRIIPGDPIARLVEQAGSAELEAALRRFYGLDQPIPVQLAGWLSGLLRGDFGYSILTRQPVLPELAARIPRTLYLMAGGLIVALLIAIPAGLIAAAKSRQWQDSALLTVTTVLLSVPQFWFGILLISFFAVSWHLLPATGYVDPTQDFVGSVRSMILPWCAIGLTASAFIARVLRSSLLDVLNHDYIRTARAKGLRERDVNLGHALRNAALPAVTVIGLEAGYLLGGAIVVEKVFSYPGMGQLIVNSIVARDYPTVQVSILFFLAAFVTVNLMTDLAYGLLDPRVRSNR